MRSSHRHPRNRLASIHIDDVDMEVIYRSSQCLSNACRKLDLQYVG